MEGSEWNRDGKSLSVLRAEAGDKHIVVPDRLNHLCASLGYTSEAYTMKVVLVLRLLLYFWDRASSISDWPQTQYVAKNSGGLLIYLPLPSECWDSKYLPSLLVRGVLGIEPRVLCVRACVRAVEALYQLSCTSTSMTKLLRVRLHNGGSCVNTGWWSATPSCSGTCRKMPSPETGTSGLLWPIGCLRSWTSERQKASQGHDQEPEELTLPPTSLISWGSTFFFFSTR